MKSKEWIGAPQPTPLVQTHPASAPYCCGSGSASLFLGRGPASALCISVSGGGALAKAETKRSLPLAAKLRLAVPCSLPRCVGNTAQQLQDRPLIMSQGREVERSAGGAGLPEGCGGRAGPAGLGRRSRSHSYLPGRRVKCVLLGAAPSRRTQAVRHHSAHVTGSPPSGSTLP